MAVKAFDLWYIVNSAKQDIQAKGTSNDLLFLKWAIDGFRELNNYNLVLPSGRSVKLELDENNEVYLPDDFVDYYKIGLCVGGYIINFDLNETICLERGGPCPCEEIEQTLRTGYCDTNNFWRTGCQYLGYVENGQYVAGVYGQGAGFYRGGYRIDWEMRKIKFDRFVSATHIILEYKSDGGIGEYGNAFIPEILIRPLTAFVHRQRCTFASENATNKFKSQMMVSQAIKFGERYVNGVKAAAAKMYGMTVDEMLATWRASIKQTPKR